MSCSQSSILIALSLILCACGEADTTRSGSLSVLTYNVAGLPAEMSKVDPIANHPLISPKLNDDDLVLV